jgi:sterol desaturase/sphingolipid hydroxylase (fatty acid hydroxylase superfamily)
MLVAGAASLLAASALGGPKQKPAAVGVGALLFFASEYSTHRFLLHAKPSENEFILDLQRRLHYDHHVEPAKLELLFLPPWALVPTLALFGGAYAAITRDRDTTASLIFGNLLGLFYYEWVHYVAHIPYKPKTPYGRYIKKYHLWHHFKNEKLWFGVTNPTFDHLVGTYLDVAEADRSSSTRVLFN